ncbi:MAG: hypothetical protein ONB23_12335 [candidate division KSB1 bacterium]|nr:hypothetical protein [candidate division KSB1 bacterium]
MRRRLLFLAGAEVLLFVAAVLSMSAFSRPVKTLADQALQLRIVYSGDTAGNLEPCG